MGNGKAFVNTILQAARRQAVVVMCLAVLAIVARTRAEEPKQRLLAEFVPPSVFAESLASSNSAGGSGTIRAVNRESAVRSMQEPSRERTAGDRWEQFETEFGVRQKDPSLVKGSLETAKYQLDKTVFAVNEFVQNMEDKLSFDYKLCSLGQVANSSEPPRTASGSPIPLWDAVENAHLKSDIDLDPARGHAFVGVRLVLPLGN